MRSTTVISRKVASKMKLSGYLVVSVLFILLFAGTASATASVSSFTSNVTGGALPLAVHFYGNGTDSPSSFYWSFGDGTTSTEQNPIHVYNTAGIFTVAFRASNSDGGNTVINENYITAAVDNLAANFSANKTSGIIPTQIQFTDGSTGGATSWLWDFGDGITSTEKNPKHTYTYAHVYSVSLTVRNEFHEVTTTKPGYIAISSTIDGDRGVLSHFIYDSVSTTVRFNDTSSGSPESWHWDFGDGTTSTEPHPVHEYTVADTYQVTLTTTKGGLTSIYTYPITVTYGTPGNYSRYYQGFFTPGMGGWDFTSHTSSFWTSVIPSELFWAIIILIPYLTIYNRTGTVIIPAVLYLFIGGTLALVMPTFLGQFYYWFLALGSAGVIYKMFIGD